MTLDYFSKLLGFEGKDKMEFNDWIKIVQDKDQESLDKMIHYCKKDVADTRDIWNMCEKHFTPKWNRATAMDAEVCIQCGSDNIIKRGQSVRGKTISQRFYCNDHKGDAGYASINKNGTFGKLGK